MFRRLESSLPPDPSFPADLEKLGLCINENDQIKQIAKPTQNFQFKISKNDRLNEMRKEAMNICIRKIVNERLTSPPLSLEEVRLPLGATKQDPHVPILVSPSLSTRKHIVLIIGDSTQDLGIFAYRYIGSQGINAGSAVDFFNCVNASRWNTPNTTSALSTPGIILTNPGQLIYRRRTQTPMTVVTWHAQPRSTAVSLPMKITQANKAPFNEKPVEHWTYVLHNILANPDYVSPSAKLYIVGIAEGGGALIKYLAHHWSDVWNDRIAAIALTDPQHEIANLKLELTKPMPATFEDLLATRTRAYCLSEEPTGTPLKDVSWVWNYDTGKVERVVEGRELYGCNCYASGEQFFGESAFCKCWGDVLSWFKLVAGLEGKYMEVGGLKGAQEAEGLNELEGSDGK